MQFQTMTIVYCASVCGIYLELYSTLLTNMSEQTEYDDYNSEIGRD